MVISDLIYRGIKYGVNSFFQLAQFAWIQVKLKDTFLHGKAKALERFEQPGATAVIGNVIGADNKHNTPWVIGGRWSVVGKYKDGYWSVIGGR